MEAGRTIMCFMCGMNISILKGDLSSYRRHMKEDHLVSLRC